MRSSGAGTASCSVLMPLAAPRSPRAPDDASRHATATCCAPRGGSTRIATLRSARSTGRKQGRTAVKVLRDVYVLLGNPAAAGG